jgi:hypothetical protein
MNELVAALARLSLVFENAVHGAGRAEVLAFVQQGGLNGGGRTVLKSLFVCCSTMIWSTSETQRRRALPAGTKFHRIQAVWDLKQVHHADTARRQKPAFIEDVDARFLIEGQSPTRFARPQ